MVIIIASSRALNKQMKELILLLLLLNLCCLSISSPEVYYITPEHGSCTVNGSTLTPCYTLQQLIQDGVLSQAKKTSIEFLLLSGTHLIPEGEALSVSNFSKVLIQPWNEWQEVEIQCLFNSSLSSKVHINFFQISQLTVISLHFSFCELKYSFTKDSGIDGSVTFSKCSFESSQKNYAVNITSAQFMSINISKCTFLSAMHGVMYVSNGYYTAIIALYITNTEFKDCSPWCFEFSGCECHN